MTVARIEDVSLGFARVGADQKALNLKVEGVEQTANGLSSAIATADSKAAAANQKAVAAKETADTVEAVSGQTPEKSGAQGGAVDDTAAVLAWAALNGRKVTREGSQYRLGTWAGTTTFAAGSRASLKGSTFRQAFGLANNNQMVEIGAGADVSGLSWAVDGSNYFRRGFRLNASAALSDFNIRSLIPSPTISGTDGRSHVLYVAGTDVRIEDGILEGFQQRNVNAHPDTDNARAIIRNLELRKFGAGASAQNMPDALFDGLYARGIGPNATPDPGQNLLTGGARHSVYHKIHQLGQGAGAAEHFIYLDPGDGVQGMRLMGASSWASGQCFVKLRGHDQFVVSDCHGAGTSMDNTPGTNEDGFRLEYCRNGVILNSSMRNGPRAGGYDGLHINNCWNLRYSNISLTHCERSSVFICTGTSSTYTLPPAGGVDNIRINGIIAEQKGTLPFLLFGLVDSAATGTCTVGNLTITGIQWAGTKAQLHAVAAGTTLARLSGTHIHMSGRARDGMFTFDWPAASPTPTIT